MINLLIVDDEEYSINYIKSNISADNSEHLTIYTAIDGSSALNTVYSSRIDIVLTDIKMPVMDGITLATEIKKYHPDCKIIFMSAYSDKEYYKSAIKLNAVDYIEKPINPGELNETLFNTIQNIKTSANHDISHVSSNEIIDLMKESLANDLSKVINDYNEVVKKVLFCKLAEIDNMWCRTGIIKFFGESNDSDDSNFNHNISELYKSFPTLSHITVLKSLKNANIIVFHLFSNNKEDLAYEKIDFIYNHFINNTYSYKTFSSLGNLVSGIKNTYNSYQTAAINLETCFISGYNKTLTNFEQENEYVFNYNDIDKIRECIVKNDKTGAVDIFNNIYTALLENRYTPVYKIKEYFVLLFEELFKVSNIKNKAANMYDINTLEELKQLFSEYIDTVFCSINSQYSLHVKKAIEYINRNYTDNKLTLESISKHVSLSSSYLCVIFKNETDMTTNEYITGYRMQKAKELLETTNDTVDSIAKKIGFTDTNHFFKIFKKMTGYSPAKYRKSFGKY